MYGQIQARLIGSGCEKGASAAISFKLQQVRIDQARAGKLGTSLALVVDGKELGRVTIEGDRALGKIDLVAEQAGITMGFDGNAASCTTRCGSRTVRSRRSSSAASASRNRKEAHWFGSGPLCLDLSKPSARRLLTKARLERLLQRQATPDLHCRIALSEVDLALLVLVDQLVETVDSKELVTHVRSVGRKVFKLREECMG